MAELHEEIYNAAFRKINHTIIRWIQWEKKETKNKKEQEKNAVENEDGDNALQLFQYSLIFLITKTLTFKNFLEIQMDRSFLDFPNVKTRLNLTHPCLFICKVIVPRLSFLKTWMLITLDIEIPNLTSPPLFNQKMSHSSKIQYFIFSEDTKQFLFYRKISCLLIGEELLTKVPLSILYLFHHFAYHYVNNCSFILYKYFEKKKTKIQIQVENPSLLPGSEPERQRQGQKFFYLSFDGTITKHEKIKSKQFYHDVVIDVIPLVRQIINNLSLCATSTYFLGDRQLLSSTLIYDNNGGSNQCKDLGLLKSFPIEHIQWIDTFSVSKYCCKMEDPLLAPIQNISDLYLFLLNYCRHFRILDPQKENTIITLINFVLDIIFEKNRPFFFQLKNVKEQLVLTSYLVYLCEIFLAFWKLDDIFFKSDVNETSNHKKFIIFLCFLPSFAKFCVDAFLHSFLTKNQKNNGWIELKSDVATSNMHWLSSGINMIFGRNQLSFIPTLFLGRFAWYMNQNVELRTLLLIKEWEDKLLEKKAAEREKESGQVVMKSLSKSFFFKYEPYVSQNENTVCIWNEKKQKCLFILLYIKTSDEIIWYNDDHKMVSSLKLK